MDRGRVELRAGRDGVVPGLETRNSGDDDIEGNAPLGCVLGCGDGLEIISGSKLEHFAKFEAACGND